MTLKRIVVTVTSLDEAKDVEKFDGYITSSYDSGHYVDMPEADDIASDNTHRQTFVFYGHDSKSLIEWITSSAQEHFAGKTKVTSTVTDVSKQDYDRLVDEDDFDLPYTVE